SRNTAADDVSELRRFSQPGAERDAIVDDPAVGVGAADARRRGLGRRGLGTARLQAGLGGIVLPGAGANEALAHGGGNGGQRRRTGAGDGAGGGDRRVAGLAGGRARGEPLLRGGTELDQSEPRPERRRAPLDAGLFPSPEGAVANGPGADADRLGPVVLRARSHRAADTAAPSRGKSDSRAGCCVRAAGGVAELLPLHLLRRVACGVAGRATVSGAVSLARAVVLAGFAVAASGDPRCTHHCDAERAVRVARLAAADADSVGPVPAD